MRQSFTEGLRLEECTLLDVVHQKRVIGRLKRVYAIDARKTVSKAITYMVDMDVNTIAVFKKDKASHFLD